MRKHPSAALIEPPGHLSHISCHTDGFYLTCLANTANIAYLGKTDSSGQAAAAGHVLRDGARHGRSLSQ